MHLTLNAHPRALDSMRDAIESDLHDHACTDRDWIDELLLAATEAATNIIQYGARSDVFELSTSSHQNKFELCFEYPGTPYTPPEAKLPDPDSLSEGSYGLFLIETLTDQVLYDTPEPGTQRVRLIKHLPG